MKTPMEHLIEQLDNAIVENKKPYGDRALSDERLFVYNMVKSYATQSLEDEKKAFEAEYSRGYDDATKEATKEIHENYSPNL
jgi:hypothetical protein